MQGFVKPVSMAVLNLNMIRVCPVSVVEILVSFRRRFGLQVSCFNETRVDFDLLKTLATFLMSR